MKVEREEQVILVDQDDQVTGYMGKQEAHIKGVLHRAFSIFVFNEAEELLIHRRALEKYHSPGLWTNTCCSHPRPGEEVIDAAHRRLNEEMGFDCDLEKAFDFTYRSDVGQSLIENEFDHVLIGRFNGTPNINPAEVASYRWEKLDQLQTDIVNRPEQYSAWFKICFPMLQKHLAAQIS